MHHAAERPIYGQWIAEELRRHGYHINPGTLYPLLRRMKEHGWLKCVGSENLHSHARKEYRLTKEGVRVLELVRIQLKELYREVGPARKNIT
jgi:PadR family transcriptional regulator, regulatory protein PadR